MNLLLVIPQFKSEYKGRNKANYYFPLGIAYISSFLKSKGINVLTYNGMLVDKKSAYDRIHAIIKKNKINIVGIGGLTGEYSNIAFYARIIKKINKQILIVLGGGFVTSNPKVSMQLIEEADFGIIGQGEVVFYNLIDKLINNRSVINVSNLIYRNNGETVVTDIKDVEMDLNLLPFPDYEGFNFIDLIEENERVSGKRVAPIIASRSCPFSCTFCFHPLGEKYNKRTIENVISEIEWLVKKYKINKFSLVDELFIDNIDNLKKFCSYMEQKNLEWECCARVNSISEEVGYILKKGKCKRVSLGLESADDSVLKSMRKGITQKMIGEALRVLRKVRIEAVGAFIFGDIEENINSVKTTIDYYLANPEYAIDLNLLRVFPGTYDYEYALAKKIIKNEMDYISKGCPYINISKLRDEKFSNLKFYIEKAISKKVRKPLLISFDKNENYYTCKYKCRRCKNENDIKVFELAETNECFCKKCAEYYHFSIIDFYEDALVNKLKEYSKQYSEMLLFPINHISLKMYYMCKDNVKINFYETRYKNISLPIIYDGDIKNNLLIINCAYGREYKKVDTQICIDNIVESCLGYE